MSFAKIVFRIAGAWGVLILVPMFFLIGKLGEQNPPAVTHPEFYYAFLGSALVWQLVFFLIASDPVRFRPLMVAAMFEKFVYVPTILILARTQSFGGGQWVGCGADFVLGILFVVAYLRTPKAT